MNCKNCGKEMEAGELVCGQCGCDNTMPETERKKIDPWKIAFPAVLSLGLLLVLSWLLYFGTTGKLLPDLRPRENNVYYKDSYTGNEKQVDSARDRVVATMGEHKLTNGQLQAFYGMQVINYLNANGADFKYEEPLDAQVYDKKTGLTWQQYFIDLALSTWKQYCLLVDKGTAEGYELPQEYQDMLDGMRESLDELAEKNGLDGAEAQVERDLGYGCTVEDYKHYMQMNYYAYLYFEHMKQNMEVSEDDINAYFAANEEYLAQNEITKDSGIAVDFRDILIKPEGGTLAQWNSCKQEAQALLDQWVNAGVSEESFAKLAKENSDDSKTKENGGLLQYVFEYYFTRVDVRHILIKPEGGKVSADGRTMVYSEAEWEACRKKAQEIYDQYLNGDRTEESFSDLAVEYSEDGNAVSGGIYTDVTKGYMVEPFDAWIFDESRKAGDTGLVKTQFGYHIMYFVHRDGQIDDWAFDEDRKAGDYAVLEADDGYHVVYFVTGDECWKRMSRIGSANEKAAQEMERIAEGATVKISYSKILLGVAEL